MESRVVLERKLKLAEEALQDLEQGLNTIERTHERDERMKGDVSHLRSKCTPLAMFYYWVEYFCYRVNIKRVGSPKCKDF